MLTTSTYYKRSYEHPKALNFK
uniref:Uncharacterized protein n=1 Tax=Arundo donax TaxID=35708 RepID=A0A0A9CB01_ARUDO